MLIYLAVDRMISTVEDLRRRHPIVDGLAVTAVERDVFEIGDVDVAGQPVNELREVAIVA